MALLNTTLQTLVVRLRDISGNVTQQKLHNRVFDAYEAKSLAFEVITPAQQAVMQQFGGRIPQLHPIGQPLLVDSWAELVQLHKPENQYQLMPRKARSNGAYGVLKAICWSAGSPFTMENCLEPMDYKLVFKAAQDHEVRNEFNLKNADKVSQTIFLDGLMQSPAASALLMFQNSLTPGHVNSLMGCHQFLSFFMKLPDDGDRHRQLKENYRALLANPTHLFLGTNTVPGRELLNYAKSKNIFVYAKKGLVYQYVV
ncbi:putative mitochondrial hypothetical protein [Leptomonas pyrrhocoris]|uniref:Uncharacterized protein n=1 Tax=Leptomonas pyrrhocoris TaxID=157538 RepID=A0A0N0E0P2_LEPPY|nr:putative mitochondrial hypothetical protein [Leptomonas pyrrhocoris]KPA86671.1 putative mitochondrial hypothetical protein [Leptomonas pyrrhocoris]|eukprot:XP_015665110.1 putative mitochondrial hypothetical protein [Leptomonas pyrrhocoris]